MKWLGWLAGRAGLLAWLLAWRLEAWSDLGLLEVSPPVQIIAVLLVLAKE